MKPTLALTVTALAAALALSACKNRDEATPSPTARSDATSTTASATPPMSTTNSSGTDTTSPGAMVSNNPTGATGTSATAPLAAADAEFVTKAAEGGQFEVEVGKLAAQKASDAAVKSFAQMLVDDHGAANEKLKQIASSHNVALSASLPADKKKEIEQLGKLSGAEFDRQFVKMVGMKDHRHDIDQFERASKNAKSDDVKNFAQSTLPTLKRHLAAAEKLPSKG